MKPLTGQSKQLPLSTYRGSLQRLSLFQPALTLLSVADEIEERALSHALETLTLRDAAEESGYSYSAIQKMVASGELTNLGDKGSPRVRRGDLPRKAIAPPTASGEPDLAEMILSGGQKFWSLLAGKVNEQ